MRLTTIVLLVPLTAFGCGKKESAPSTPEGKAELATAQEAAATQITQAQKLIQQQKFDQAEPLLDQLEANTKLTMDQRNTVDDLRRQLNLAQGTGRR